MLQTRDVTLNFHRTCSVNTCRIERNGAAREYQKITESSIGRMQRLVRKNRIEIEVDFIYFTEIRFQFDKEIDEPEEEEFPVYYDAQGREHAEF